MMLIVDQLKTHYADPDTVGLIEHETIGEMVPVQRMFRETKYARALHSPKVKKLVANWDSDACDVLVVSLRPDGRYAIIDGCHRHRAAELRGLDVLPCRVFLDLSLAREAELFVMLNRDRTAPTSMDIYRGRLAADEPAAVDLREVVRLSGYDIAVDGKGPGRIEAIAVLERLYNSNGPQELLDVLSIIRDAWGIGQYQRALHGHILEGLGVFWMRYKEEFNRGRLVERLGLQKPDVILAEAHAFQTLRTGVAAHSAVGHALVDRYNRGLKGKQRLREWQDHGVVGSMHVADRAERIAQRNRDRRKAPGEDEPRES